MDPESDAADRQRLEWEFEAAHRASEEETVLMDSLQNEAERALKRLTIQHFPAFKEWDAESIRAADEVIWRSAARFTEKLAELSFRHGKARER